MSEESTTQGEDLMLVIVREFPAPIKEVWAALTDLDQTPEWWGPHGFHVPPESIDVDPEIGGPYRACMVKDDTGEERWWSGIQTDIEPPALFMFTHAWDKPDGTRGYETEVTFRLEETGAGTRMTFSQGPFESVESRESHAAGWRESFDKLADYLATGA